MKTRRRLQPSVAKFLVGSFVFSFCFATWSQDVWATVAEAYNPPWGGQLNWVSSNLFAEPLGSLTYLEERDVPWWQNRVANPIRDYSGDKLPTGSVRLDSALDVEMTLHRPLPAWSVQRSPSGINDVYSFTPGSTHQDPQTARSGQNAYFDFAAHPFQSVSANIGAELVGNNDQRFWFPINDELRMSNENTHARVVTGEVKYDDKTFMLRGFEGVPSYGWLGQNDLFRLLPAQDDVEYYRRYEGNLIPRGGEMRVKSTIGTLDVIGGSEMEMRYGSSVFAKYDFPTFRNLENTLVYRNQQIPYGLEDPHERKWSLSYNASYPFSERTTAHFGILYQPFRLNRPYQDLDNQGVAQTYRSMQRDALGGTARVEFKPTRLLDSVGLGYTYEGPVAGDKQEVDVDGSRALTAAWTLASAYIYRQPVRGPVPLQYEGTVTNPGALVASPRGPDDPFWVQWDNRKAHIGSLTLVYDPTPATPFFTAQPNLLEDWNLNPQEDAEWTGAVQYRVTEYPTNTDRLYYWDEDGNLFWDPANLNGAYATKYPFSSATGVLRWTKDDWRVAFTFSGGQALAGDARAYTPATNFFKPSTTFLDGEIRLNKGPWMSFLRYGQDEYGPFDYFDQLGWAYHRVYQAGLSYQFLKAFEAGFRYIGTRMTDEFIGSNVGAFNEYRCYLTYHFTLEHNFGKPLAALGKPLPQTFPEASLTLSDKQFTPDGSGDVRSIVVTPKAFSESGILTYKVFIRNGQGETVKGWEGTGTPPNHFAWDGLTTDGQPLPAGIYRATLDIVDQYGNEITSPAQSVEIVSARPVAAASTPSYQVTTTVEGLRVTLSSLVLFDVDKVELKDSARQSLDQVITLLKAYPTNRLRVSGYTDSSGSRAHNQVLSESRAQAVSDYLTSHGITPSRVQTLGFGDRRPLASNKTEEGRQQNRRVEIDILK